jgi:hypothetical protein
MPLTKKYIGIVFLIIVACSSNKSNQQRIIGTWTSYEIATENDLSKASIYTYNKDSSYNVFFGDYDSNGRYYIHENQLYTTYPNGDTNRATIIELNDSVLRLKHEVSDFESTEFRLGFK